MGKVRVNPRHMRVALSSYFAMRWCSVMVLALFIFGMDVPEMSLRVALQFYVAQDAAVWLVLLALVLMPLIARLSRVSEVDVPVLKNAGFFHYGLWSVEMALMSVLQLWPLVGSLVLVALVSYALEGCCTDA